MARARTAPVHPPIPGRYQVNGYMGKRFEMVHRWTHLEEATRVAKRVLEDGYSERMEGRYTAVKVEDRLTRQVVWMGERAKRSYG
jgi:hypothetical protein